MTTNTNATPALEYCLALAPRSDRWEAEAELRALMAERDRLRAALGDANRGNERLSAELDSVRHAHISAMTQRDNLGAHLAAVLDEADRYSDEMRRIGRGSMEFGADAPGHSLSGMARAALEGVKP